VYAAVIAAKGLSTWKRQLLGQNTFEIARALGREVRDLQAEFSAFRSPFVFENETKAAQESIDKEQQAKDISVSTLFAWRRAQTLSEAWNKVSDAAYDAEVILGTEITPQILELQKLVLRARQAIAQFEYSSSELRGVSVDQREAISDRLQEYRKVLWGTEEDAFGLEITKAIPYASLK